ncbi:MAG TPA: hypothetical protein VFT49_03070 [Candidatus Saccharimonadales bacterium]|nr:hypothetical protein [Candidatus Saccharimonadales bacterium]
MKKSGQFDPGLPTPKPEVSETWGVLLNNLGYGIRPTERATRAASLARKLFEYPSFELPVVARSYESTMTDFHNRFMVAGVLYLSNSDIYESGGHSDHLTELNTGKVSFQYLMREYCETFPLKSSRDTYDMLKAILSNARTLVSGIPPNETPLQRAARGASVSRILSGIVAEYIGCEGFKKIGFPLTTYSPSRHDIDFAEDIMVRAQDGATRSFQIKTSQTPLEIDRQKRPTILRIPLDIDARKPGFALHPHEAAAFRDEVLQQAA